MVVHTGGDLRTPRFRRHTGGDPNEVGNRSPAADITRGGKPDLAAGTGGLFLLGSGSG